MIIGIAGLGRMGGAMADRLIAVGHPVRTWNRTPRTIAGIGSTSSPKELVETVDVVLVSLLDHDAVEAVYGGEQGLGAASLGGKLVIDTSTVAPATTLKAAQIIRQGGGRFVDAPVLGTVSPCRRGELVAMVGGMPDDFVEARQALQPLTRAVHHMGPVGSGVAAKLAVNLVMGSYWAALGDALALGSTYSLDPVQLLDIIADGPAALAQLPAKRPVLEGRGGAVEYSLSGYVKDLRAILAAAGPHLNLPIAQGAFTKFSGAEQAGFGDADVAAVALNGATSIDGKAAF